MSARMLGPLPFLDLRFSRFCRMRAAQGALLVLCAAALAAGCRGDDAGDPARTAHVRFTDVTEAAGIARETPTYDAAVGDIDGDGFPDLYVGNHAAGAVLLRNQGDGTFRDVLPGSGIAPDGDQHGTGLADFDGDGRLDLYVALGAGRGRAVKANRLYRNAGDGTFTDVAEAAGVIDPTGRSRAVAWLDVDLDDALDLVLVNFASPNRFYRNRGDGSFEDRSTLSGIAALSGNRVVWGDYDGDGFPDLLLSGTPKGLRLLRNERGPSFRDVTREAGLEPLKEPVQGMAFGDYDGDGDLDLALSFGADFGEGVVEDEGLLRFAFFAHDEPAGFDFALPAGAAGADVELYENGAPVAPERVRCGDTPTTSHRFVCAADAAARGVPAADGPAFLLWRDPGEMVPCASCEPMQLWHLRWSGAGDHHLSGMVRGASRPVRVGLGGPIHRGAALYRNERGVFERHLDTTDGLPAEAAVNGQAVAWGDVDNDGWLDLYLVDSGVDGAGAHNVLLLNERGERFVAVPVGAGATPPSGAGRGVGAHFLDYDRDGRLDLFLTNGWGAPPFDRGPYHLLRNESTAGHWLALELRGAGANRPALGAWVDLEACGERRTRHHDGGRSPFSQSLLPVHFGLGACEEVDVLTVHWPSGRVTRLTDLAVDRTIVVEEER